MKSSHSMNQMNTTSPRFRVPERWLLIGLDDGWCDTAKQRLVVHAESLPSASFLAWRLAHGLIRIVAPDELDNELKNALSRPDGTEVMPNATRLWAAMTADQWFDISKSCVALRWPRARGLDVSLLSSDDSSEAAEDFAGFVEAAEQPDALARFSWLMSERPMPVPRNWLSLGPIPGLSEAQNAAMADEGYRCYSAWAAGVLASYGPEELQELWGPFPDDEDAEQEGGETGNTVVPFQRPLTEQPRPQGRPVADGRRFRTRDTSFSDGRLAASSASDDGKTSPLPAHTWLLESTISHGAYSLQACVRPPKSADDEPAIEFVALWDDERTMPAKPGDIRLVLTLSRRKPVLLTGRPDATPAAGSLYSLRFDWPRDSWPEELRQTPPVRLGRPLKAALEKARVSLM